MTEQLTLKNMYVLDTQAEVLEVLSENDQTILVLDKTSFHPQGGGQPSDTGSIYSGSSEFIVKKVIKSDDKIFHHGEFKNGQFNIGEKVECKVDKERRTLNSRIHSAGHLIDMALKILQVNLKPLKGYHFPDGPYVEYEGEISQGEIEKLKLDLEKQTNELVEQNLKSFVSFTDESENNRVISFGSYGTHCGGTHLKNSVEIGSVEIRKIKIKQGHTKISYDIKS